MHGWNVNTRETVQLRTVNIRLSKTPRYDFGAYSNFCNNTLMGLKKKIPVKWSLQIFLGVWRSESNSWKTELLEVNNDLKKKKEKKFRNFLKLIWNTWLVYGSWFVSSTSNVSVGQWAGEDSEPVLCSRGNFLRETALLSLNARIISTHAGEEKKGRRRMTKTGLTRILSRSWFLARLETTGDQPTRNSTCIAAARPPMVILTEVLNILIQFRRRSPTWEAVE